ncbi:uncharacterized protein LOC103313756 isoform X2 [Tribolium castaneum]|uniref:Uncharacterized protein n=1 Tax=Tribolium castaneum TaxID=7070 RepID=A0A139WDW2_TRICA|nr:PREDICTED: uncharacterized protein LOC103313756 isoform X2 [Tribolium castaneum]KYB26067.1 hypothetical protein TcasGA2_TC006059 [Tribolium castaneum]|eukprot:XP_008196075.1 PREDICTED: uncharacterized protein LOC103313756 isoform X2 [Tribolium castaneum]
MKTQSVIFVLALLGACSWEDEDDSSSDSDDFPDNEVPIVATEFPPNHIYDPFLDTEVPDGPYFNPNRIVDFIGIKHRFSNESNLAFPPYVNTGKRRKAIKKNKKKIVKKHKKNSKTGKKSLGSAS